MMDDLESSVVEWLKWFKQLHTYVHSFNLELPNVLNQLDAYNTANRIVPVQCPTLIFSNLNPRKWSIILPTGE